MKGWVGLVSWPAADSLRLRRNGPSGLRDDDDDERTVYPYKWLPITCRSGAGHGKFADQRPTFFQVPLSYTVCCFQLHVSVFTTYCTNRRQLHNKTSSGHIITVTQLVQLNMYSSDTDWIEWIVILYCMTYLSRVHTRTHVARKDVSRACAHYRNYYSTHAPCRAAASETHTSQHHHIFV